MDKEYKENFNNLDNYELKDSTVLPVIKKVFYSTIIFNYFNYNIGRSIFSLFFYT